MTDYNPPLITTVSGDGSWFDFRDTLLVFSRSGNAVMLPALGVPLLCREGVQPNEKKKDHSLCIGQ